MPAATTHNAKSETTDFGCEVRVNTRNLPIVDLFSFKNFVELNFYALF